MIIRLRTACVVLAVFGCSICSQAQVASPEPRTPQQRVPLQPKVQVSPGLRGADAPTAREAPGIRPSGIARFQVFQPYGTFSRANTAVRLTAAADARAFVDWAGQSRAQDRERVRSAIAARSADTAFAQALCNEAFEARDKDHSRALVVLSILGEMKSPAGEDCLTRFVHLPLPEKGLVIEGENVQQASLATLQAKAVQGLGYLRTVRGDQEVLAAVQGHPSPIVRAAAIDAYLWNHGSSPDARTTLQKYARPDEHVFMDRIRREYGEPAQPFNNKIAAYVRVHPEVRALPLERLQPSQIQNKVKPNPGVIQQRNPSGIDRQRQVIQPPRQVPIQEAPPVR
jgi:hypothetical protein